MDMYKEQILDHYKNPRNFGDLEGATHSFDGKNPSCGDEIKFDFIVQDGKIVDVKFSGRGCAISMASASLLSEKVKGMTVDEAMKLTKDDVLTLMGIEIGPVRLKCALLPLETIHKTIEKE